MMNRFGELLILLLMMNSQDVDAEPGNWTYKRLPSRRLILPAFPRPLDVARKWIAKTEDPVGLHREKINETIGYGVFTDRRFEKSEFILVYRGDFLPYREAVERERKYKLGGAYMYYFPYQNKKYCVDATRSEGLCRYANDIDIFEPANAKMRIVEADGKPHLCLFATDIIEAGCELRYDYGYESVPWRKKSWLKTRIEEEDVGQAAKSKESATKCKAGPGKASQPTQPMVAETQPDKPEAPEGPLTASDITQDEGEAYDFRASAVNEQGVCEPLVTDRSIVAKHPFDKPGDPGRPNVDDVGADSYQSEPTIFEEQTDENILPNGSQPNQNSCRPGRYCIYCQNVILGGKLKRHISMKHKNEHDVKTVLLENKISQNTFFDELRRKGMYMFNQKVIQTKGESYAEMMRERRSKQECSGCKSFFSNRSFYLHVKKCTNANTNAIKPEALKLNRLLPVLGERMDSDKEFQDLLNTYSDKPASRLVCNTRIIQKIGWRHFCLRKAEKTKMVEIRRCVATEMRELARLFLVFQSHVGSPVIFNNMFERKYLEQLLDALDEIGEGKHGTKLNVHATLMRTIKTMKGILSDEQKDADLQELCKFQESYNYRAPEILAEARYKTLSHSLQHRRPDVQQKKDSLVIFKSYVANELLAIMTAFNITKYARLRNLLVARLTLFNARRGEEPSRMTLTEWSDALNDVWLPEEEVSVVIDPAEKHLLGLFLLCYLHGKGKKFVPVLIPKDIVEPMKLLVSKRTVYGIPKGNQFVFASKSLENHCSGWHAIDAVCSAAGVKLTATKTRHMLSTLYASLDMKEQDRKAFLDHMGHEEQINKDDYQTPIGIKEVRVMGEMLTLAESSVLKSSEVQNQQTKPVSYEPTINYEPASNKRPRLDDDDDENSRELGSDDEVILKYPRTLPTEKKRKRSKENETTRKKNVQWTEEDVITLRTYFQEFFDQDMDKKHNKGSLPGKSEILKFVEMNYLASVHGLNTQQKYLKMRTKLFNDRKIARQKVIKAFG